MFAEWDAGIVTEEGSDQPLSWRYAYKLTMLRGLPVSVKASYFIILDYNQDDAKRFSQGCEFEILVTTSSIRRALKYRNWSKKTAKQKAKERNADLRDAYFCFISDLSSYHLVYVDESGCDKWIGFRRTGWSPCSITPSQVTKFHRHQRYQILAAYSPDGVCIP